MLRQAWVGHSVNPGRGSRIVRILMLSAIVLLPFRQVMVLEAQQGIHIRPSAVDPGPRPGRGAGGPIAGLSTDEMGVWTNVNATFKQVNSVSGSGPTGLGPRFNSNSCVSCHAQPAAGGASPATNPLFSVYQLNGAQNTMPFFETANGPALHARFPFSSDLVTVDGNVHQDFVITGRIDAGGCNIAQPTFQLNNLALRNPIATFGDGLIETIQNSDILNNMTAQCNAGATLGICGTPSISGNDGSVNRLGWKAQERSLQIAAALWYNVEEGVTNELFPNEIDETPGCATNPVPESASNFAATQPFQFPADPERFAIFMRFLAPPRPAPPTSSTTNGRIQFNTIGCVLCHTTSFKTPSNFVAALGNIQANLFSDLLLHHMGPCLADGIVQGAAKGDMFRTPPLWGVGQRIFFLHDGRTQDIVAAVQDHFCGANGQYPASEANAVVNAFNALSPQNQQDLINFLRSL